MVHKKGGKERLMDRALFDLGPQLARFGHLTIIGRGRAKYRDLSSEASRSATFRNRKLKAKANN